jgi:L-threonylcarbamoyladenylate synthase
MKNMVRILSCDSDFVGEGREIYSGQIVIFPTDTVFGLGSNPRLRQAIQRCYEIKKRPLEKQIPVLFSEITAVAKFVEFNGTGLRLAKEFWPGKLSIILPAKDVGLPEELVGQSKTLAVRIPNHPCCRRLIASCGGSLIGTSANFSGADPFTNPDEKGLVELSSYADFFVIGKCSEDRKSSTVVDITNPSQIKILREGAISSEAIIHSIGKNEQS